MFPSFSNPPILLRSVVALLSSRASLNLLRREAAESVGCCVSFRWMFDLLIEPQSSRTVTMARDSSRSSSV